MYMKCCERCFSEVEISKFIHENGEDGICEYCKSRDVKVFSLKKIGNFIKDGLKRSYEDVAEGTGAIWDNEEERYIGNDGDEAGKSIYEILMQDQYIFSSNIKFEYAEKLLEDIFKESEVSWRDVVKGESNEFENIYEPRYVLQSDLYGVEIVNEHIAWEEFVYTTKFFNRFFDVDTNVKKRKELLENLSGVFKYLEEYIEKDDVLFRVRSIDIENIKSMDNNSFYKEISPAPNLYSKNNRMSPKGISYMYLSDNVITCCLETRLEKSKRALVGKFVPKKRLKILNLSKEIFIHTESMFSKSYVHSENWINEFVKDFEKEISKPISENDNELEYVSTQILSEYIRSCGFDGIKFESSIASCTYNYTLFCGPDSYLSRCELESNIDNFMKLKSFTKWLKLESITYIKYNNEVKILSKKSIDEFKDPFFSISGGHMQFDDIDEIRTELCDVQKEIVERCVLPNNNFNILQVLLHYVDRYNKYRTFFIIINNSFDSIEVLYGTEGDRENNETIRLEKKNKQSILDLLNF